MKVKVKKEKGCRRRLTITVEQTEMEPVYQDIVKTYMEYAFVPGFRRGKAPSYVIENRFRQKILQDVRDEIVSRYFHKAVEEEKLDVACVVDVNVTEFDREVGILFDVLIDLKPEVKLANYRKITLNRPDVKVGENDIQMAIDRLRERFATYKDVEREARWGDVVLLDFYGKLEDGRILSSIEGVPPEISNGIDAWFLLDSSRGLPGFSDGIVGMKRGEVKDICIKFPVDYHIKNLGGKTVIYNVSLKAIKERILPEVTDNNFLKAVGANSPDELKDRIKSALEQEMEVRVNQILKNQIIEYLIQKSKIEPPEGEVAYTARQMLIQRLEEYARSGLNKDEIKKRIENDKESILKQAEDYVKHKYILDEIAKEESITVDDKDIEVEVAGIAERYNISADQARQLIERNIGIDELKNRLRRLKVLDFLVKEVKLK